jgi:ribose/xylose/arabinose/galactoside ABC-type transport system permease subunit
MKIIAINVVSAVLVGLITAFTVAYFKNPFALIGAMMLNASIGFVTGWLIGWERCEAFFNPFGN